MNKVWNWLGQHATIRDIAIGMLIMSFFWIFFSLRSCDNNPPTTTIDSINLDNYRQKVAELSIKSNRLIAENLLLKQQIDELKKHPVIKYTPTNTVIPNDLQQAYFDTCNKLYNYEMVYGLMQQELANDIKIIKYKDDIIREDSLQIDTMLTVIFSMNNDRLGDLKTISELKEGISRTKRTNSFLWGGNAGQFAIHLLRFILKF